MSLGQDQEAPRRPDGAPDATGAAVSVEYCGEWYRVAWGDVFEVGREADLTIDENPFLHRRFLRLSSDAGLWWLENIGARISATVCDVGGGVQSWLPPGARLPLVFPVSTVTFLAGPTSYEFDVYLETSPYREVRTAVEAVGATTVGEARWTTSQLQLIVALAEPLLRRTGSGLSEIPSSAAAARRLGWTLTRFNRKLDNVCDKLDRHGVKGLRGGPAGHATSRRIRLVEYAVTSRLVTAAHLGLLDLEVDE
ncbi:hypothetical protein N867_13430 [Actinotalea fermentans ATCC 43279 = JCM 9966 = DSM 3133]|uniref:FHA domain-containing protein n=1 Tax=Actinotalea fermentans TaxID=43671 RepID=A0A511YZ65_9CELL|nr:hypothetical protein N867_13430 [Actinotalea fermentans ATCC 43279 = JCM 9966 = DSM 3133]GEN80488.1 hypothetical protein AFE02nite_22220 [Actinotalea fermentans]